MKATKLSLSISSIATLTLPLFFLNFTANQFELNKLVLLALATSALLVLFVAKTIWEKRLKLSVSPIHIPLLIFIAVELLSLQIAGANKFTSFVSETLPFILCTFLFFLLYDLLVTVRRRSQDAIPASDPTIEALESLGIATHVANKDRAGLKIENFFILSSTILSTFTLAQYFFADGLPAQFSLNNNFSPAGTLTGHLLVVLLGISLLGLLIAKTIKDSQSVKKYIGLPLLGLLIALHVTSVVLITPKVTQSPLSFTPVKASWVVALESIKRSPFLGSGPGSYLNTYSLFRPLWTNDNKYWNVRFAAASNTLLHTVTTTGLVGLLIYVILLIRLLRPLLNHLGQVRTNPQILLNEHLPILALIATIFCFFIPIGIVPTFCLFVFLALGLSSLHDRSKSLDIDLSQKFTQLPAVLIGITFAGVALILYVVGRTYAAEIEFRNASIALSQNRGLDSYNHLKSAIKYNPDSDANHTAIATTSLLLADALAKKPDLSDKERQTFTQLIQQAISEAKKARDINPRSSKSWESLAQIYIQITPIIKQAADWALTSLNQAIVYDPANPALYFELGTFYANIGRLPNAQQAFTNAILLKEDYANAYYNLAEVLSAQKLDKEAQAALEKVLELVDKNTSDYTTAKAKLDSLKSKNKPVIDRPKEASQSGELRIEKPIPTPNPSSPTIKVPEPTGAQLSP